MASCAKVTLAKVPLAHCSLLQGRGLLCRSDTMHPLGGFLRLVRYCRIEASGAKVIIRFELKGFELLCPGMSCSNCSRVRVQECRLLWGLLCLYIICKSMASWAKVALAEAAPAHCAMLQDRGLSCRSDATQ